MKKYLSRLAVLLNRKAYIGDETVLPEADHALKHEMNVLGSGWVNNHYGMQTAGFEGNNYSDPELTFEKIYATIPEQFRERADRISALLEQYQPGYTPIDWGIDLKSGGRYDIIPAGQIKFGIQEGVDAKMTADMNRHYPLVFLGRAWMATGDRKYVAEFIAQFLDWMRMNPAGYGAAWRGNMNVSIRIVNLLCGFSLIVDALDEEKDAPVLALLAETVDDHIRYISENLEFTELPTSLHPNHYIANLTGLLLASAFAGDDNPSAKAWERVALRELKLTFDWQINPDGIDFEATTMYHAFAIEMFMYAFILTAKIHGAVSAADVTAWLKKELGDGRVAIMEKMFISLDDLVSSNGLLPVVGDADSGRYVYLEHGENPDRDRRFLLSVGAALLGEKVIKGAAGTDPLAAKAFFPEFEAIPENDYRKESAGYAVSGFYTIRGARDSYSAFINCAPIGTGGLGSHAHNDRLEVLLTVGGEDIIIDPGVYAYTASRYWRGIYRDAGVHATVLLADTQPNRLAPPDAWWGYRDDTQCRCLEWTKEAGKTRFVGESYAYQRLETPIVHRRTVEGAANELTVVDEFLHHKAGKTDYAAEWNFTLAPGAHVVGKPEGGNVTIAAGCVTVSLSIENGAFELSEGRYAPVYGAQAPTEHLKVRLEKMPESNRIHYSWTVK